MEKAYCLPCCRHTIIEHVFEKPFCSDLKLWQKVAHAFFHTLTFAIPLTIYHVVKWIRVKIDEDKTNLKILYTYGQPVLVYLNMGRDALRESMRMLKEHENVRPWNFIVAGKRVFPPTDVRISKLSTILYEVEFVRFKDALKSKEWNDDEVLKCADRCLKLAYAISSLTLDDLKTYSKHIFDKGYYATPLFGEKTKLLKSDIDCLSAGDNYTTLTFYFLTHFYHSWIREAWKWNGSHFSGSMPSPNPLFYTPGTIQNSWRLLYNDWCQRVEHYVNPTILQMYNKNIQLWAQKDLDPESFQTNPTPLPNIYPMNIWI